MNSELFSPLTIEEAPEASRPLLEKIEAHFGFVPNLTAKMANSPALLRGYLSGDGALSNGTFKGVERQLILLVASVENRCEYSIAVHASATKRLGLQPGAVEAVKASEPLADTRLDALVNLTREMVRERGHIHDETIQAFLQAGWSKEQILEVLLAVAIKTISSYLDHISHTQLDRQFEAERFSFGKS